MSFQGDWLFNTDEAEAPGEGTYPLMLQQSCVAAWGADYNADILLAKPLPGHRVFFYVNGIGIVAKATFTAEKSFKSNTIFGKEQEGEFHRKVVDLVMPKIGPLSYTFVHEQTGYYLPVKGLALCKIHDSSAAAKIAAVF